MLDRFLFAVVFWCLVLCPALVTEGILGVRRAFNPRRVRSLLLSLRKGCVFTAVGLGHTPCSPKTVDARHDLLKTAKTRSHRLAFQNPCFAFDFFCSPMIRAVGCHSIFALSLRFRYVFCDSGVWLALKIRIITVVP